VRRLHSAVGLLGILVVVLGMAPAMFGDITDYMLNINGATYCPGDTNATGCTSTGGFAAAPGTLSTINETYNGTGLGTVTVTFNPGPGGPYNVNLWLFEQLSEQGSDTSGPGYNEYGVVSGASPGPGETYQIDVPDYDSGGDPNTSAEGNIIANTLSSSLDGKNDVPGTTDAVGCSPSPNCNDFTSLALGFNFNLGANEEELISFSVSTSRPASGFYLEQIHPADDPNGSGDNPEIDYYFTGTATTQSTSTPPPPSIPEPGSIFLLAPVAVLLFLVFRSRSAAVNEK